MMNIIDFVKEFAYKSTLCWVVEYFRLTRLRGRAPWLSTRGPSAAARQAGGTKNVIMGWLALFFFFLGA